MKSPFGWCVVAACLATYGVATATAQDVGGDYAWSEPFAGTEPAAGFRVQADALIWSRTDGRSSGPIIGGPESFSLGGLSNSYVGGYRIGAAWLIDPNYEFEGVWTSFADWTADSGGVLSRAISFNDGQASVLVDPTGNANFINRGTFFRPIHDAAMDPLALPAIQNYAFLNPGSTYSLYSTSNLYDIQANFKTRRSFEQRFSFGVGYRNIRLDEGTSALITGVFGTNDLPGGGDTHTILTDEALTGNGLTLVSGAADGWTDTLGDTTTLALLWDGATTNNLNGVQGTVDASLWERGIFTLEGVLRAGLFYNRMSGSVRELYAGGGADDSVYERTFTDQRDAVSFASNIGLNGVVQLSDAIRFRTGYEVMFLTNVALSGDQQSGITYNSLGDASYAVKGGGSVVLHGLRIGLEMIW